MDRGGGNMNQYRGGYEGQGGGRGGYEGQGGGRGGYRDYGGGQREQSHANFGMRRDRRDSDRQHERPPYEELREATAGEWVRESYLDITYRLDLFICWQSWSLNPKATATPQNGHLEAR